MLTKLVVVKKGLQRLPQALKILAMALLFFFTSEACEASVRSDRSVCDPSVIGSCKNCEELNQWVASNKRPSSSIYLGNTFNPLYTAYELDCEVAADIIVERGADINVGGERGSMALTVLKKPRGRHYGMMMRKNLRWAWFLRTHNIDLSQYFVLGNQQRMIDFNRNTMSITIWNVLNIR